MDRLYRRIALDLLDGVVSHDIPAADWLPRIDDIAARYACTPTVAREAVRALVERGIVDAHRGRGHQVNASDRWNLLDPDVASAVLLDHPTRELTREAVEAFTLVQTQAAMLAAKRMISGDIALLEGSLERMRDASEGRNGTRYDWDQFVGAEAEFHETLTRLSHNRFLLPMVSTLHAVIAEARRDQAPERDQAAIRLHENIVAALREADAAAAAAAIEAYGSRLRTWLAT
jgi:DNA-binding FadR family transcriptional regulator